MGRRKLIAGNWKMHGLRADLAHFSDILAGAGAYSARCDLMIAPPFTLIDRCAGLMQDKTVFLGAQDAHWADSGAHTGCVSAPMLAEMGVTHVILGHSERREEQQESDALIKAKAQAVLRAGQNALICVGESEDERVAGQAETRVARQVAACLPDDPDPARVVLCYEPIWAIGTGRIPTLDDIDAVHRAVRRAVAQKWGESAAQQMRILYGGSVKPDNARDILALDEVDGALVGGASLKADSFLAIAAAVS